MLGRLILLIVLGGGLVWFLYWFRTTPPEQVARVLRRSFLWGAIGFLALLAITGRLNPLFAAVAAAIPFAMRAINLLGVLPLVQQLLRALGLRGIPSNAGGKGGGSGQTSSIRTRFLDMTLDHATGAMDGLVQEGPAQGQHLSGLSLAQLLDLLDLYRRDDPQSAAVLEAYLDRERGEAWREQAPGGDTQPPRAGQAMTKDEALAILGLTPGASASEIREAHRRLMQRNHPDRGGSDYLAAKINEAKRLLLGD